MSGQRLEGPAQSHTVRGNRPCRQSSPPEDSGTPLVSTAVHSLFFLRHSPGWPVEALPVAPHEPCHGDLTAVAWPCPRAQTAGIRSANGCGRCCRPSAHGCNPWAPRSCRRGRSSACRGGPQTSAHARRAAQALVRSAPVQRVHKVVLSPAEQVRPVLVS